MSTLTLTQVVKRTGIKRRTFYNMLKDKRFPVKPIKGTKPRRWDADKVDAWVKSQ